MKSSNLLFAAASLGILSLGACQPKTPAQKVEDKVEDAGHNIEQGVERAGEKVEKKTNN